MAHVCYLGSFALDGIAQVLFHHAHCGDGVGAQCLDDLQGRHQMVFVDFLQDCGEFVTGLFQYPRTRCEVC